MKKMLLLSAILAFFCACSSDSESGSSSVAGQYIYENDTLLVALNFDENAGSRIDIFINSYSAYLGRAQCSGEYPNYSAEYRNTYEVELVLDCSFNSSGFTGTVIGETNLKGANWAQAPHKDKPFTLPRSMRFKKDGRVLDVNGDGVLDSMQKL